MQTSILFMILLTISTPAIICGIIPDEEVKVILPGEFTPKKEAFFWQRQIIILLVPNNGFGVGGLGGLGGVAPGGFGQSFGINFNKFLTFFNSSGWTGIRTGW